MRSCANLVCAAAVALIVAAASSASAQLPVKDMYARAQDREAGLRANPAPPVSAFRSVVAAYEAVVRRYPGSGYVDNALLQGAAVALDAYERFRIDRDRQTAERLLRWLVAEYPHSRLTSSASAQLEKLASASAAPATPPDQQTAAARPKTASAGEPAATTPEAGPLPPTDVKPAATVSADEQPAAMSPNMLHGVTRVAMGRTVRVTIAMDREASYQVERIDGPARLVIDFRDVKAPLTMMREGFMFTEGPVRQARLGLHPKSVMRVVLDLEGIGRHTIFALYGPYRLVVDCDIGATPSMTDAGAAVMTPAPRGPTPAAPMTSPSPTPKPTPATPSPLLSPVVAVAASNENAPSASTSAAPSTPPRLLAAPQRLRARPIVARGAVVTAPDPLSIWLPDLLAAMKAAAVVASSTERGESGGADSLAVLGRPIVSPAKIVRAPRTVPSKTGRELIAGADEAPRLENAPTSTAPTPVTGASTPTPPGRSSAPSAGASSARSGESSLEEALPPAPVSTRSAPETPTPQPTIASRPPAPIVIKGAPTTNARGGYSIARQLGLGVSRIVIDPGHGGHDPGARGAEIQEAELVLDVALRLEKLLEKQQDVEVVLTRRDDSFIALNERTAIANREGADLFLSIHANASRNTLARGVETYFLNFAPNPEAEAIAARENAAFSGRMGDLGDIVKAITLNGKIDESREFASIIQSGMTSRMRSVNKTLRDLGVKQAPFVVLIGAAMPSVLAEISFLTNPNEGRLLKSGAYRQRIAESLRDGILKYQKSLKNTQTAATQ